MFAVILTLFRRNARMKKNPYSKVCVYSVWIAMFASSAVSSSFFVATKAMVMGSLVSVVLPIVERAADTEEVLAKGLCERIGIDGGMVTYQPKDKDKIKKNADMPDHTEAVKLVIDSLIDKENGVISSLDEIGAVGHRIVHGGESFSSATLINDEVIKVDGGY